MTDTAVAQTYPCANSSCDRKVCSPKTFCCSLCASRRDRGTVPSHSAMCERKPND